MSLEPRTLCTEPRNGFMFQPQDLRERQGQGPTKTPYLSLCCQMNGEGQGIPLPSWYPDLLCTSDNLASKDSKVTLIYSESLIYSRHLCKLKQ